VLAAGIVAVTSVEETLFTLVAGVDPKLTPDTPERLAPIIVAVPPPARGEESGVIEVIVGAVEVEDVYV
jgi:phage terminase large subunit-like protein